MKPPDIADLSPAKKEQGRLAAEPVILGYESPGIVEEMESLHLESQQLDRSGVGSARAHEP